MSDDHSNLAAWVLLIILKIPLVGWVVSVGWEWFLVPIGAPPINLWHGIGLAMFGRWALDTGPGLDHDPELHEAYAKGLGLPLVMLGILWLIQLGV